MRLPKVDGQWGDIDVEKVSKMVDAFIENGFTAWMYHNFTSEDCTKKFLVERHPRESFTLATKLPASFLKCKEDRDVIFNKQLEKTGAGYFDYYLLHDMNTTSFDLFEKEKLISIK